MWFERPKTWTDGLFLATALGLVLSVIVSIERETDMASAPLPQCQEVVVFIHQEEEILARCPVGTWLDIVDDNVVCRCGPKRELKLFERAPNPVPRPPPTQRIPQADPSLKDDKRGVEI